GELVVFDMGAMLDGYCSDGTRTFATGEPGEPARQAYETVREAQEAALGAVRAGIGGEELDGVARGAIEAAGYGERFGHGLGHGVGLEIHEEPMFHRSSTGSLPLGTVVTVEPGVYLPGLGGVRIEDMVEITADGAREIPRSTKELVVL
ncbi:MAG TPA: M24 family metallopeptidase, partial [Actinomycetota bacterium]|nr:M24 family metallopeptidase [Actinomycetota bacterium]